MSGTNPVDFRRARRAGRHTPVLALLASVSLSACGGDDEDSDQAAGPPDASAPGPSPDTSPASGDENTTAPEGTPIRITFGDAELTARLDDNATARGLVRSVLQRHRPDRRIRWRAGRGRAPERGLQRHD